MGMSLPSIQLDAFVELAKVGNFSKAAQNLHITQSALSQRIRKLEEELQTTLLIRNRSGIRLTETGEKLLRYCHSKNRLEEEAIESLKSKDSKELAGVVRVAAFSSVLRSVVIPSLAPLIQKNPKLLCEFKSYEMNELPDALQRGQADFAVIDYKWEKDGVETVSLGFEEYVVIESKRHDVRPDVYLDHDTADSATHHFFRAQTGKYRPFRRSFMGEVYGILDGVRLGLGRAVMSRHLVEENSSIRILNQFKPRRTEVFLHYFEQPYYSKLHQAIRDALEQYSPYARESTPPCSSRNVLAFHWDLLRSDIG